MDIQITFDTKEFLSKLDLEEYDEPEEVSVTMKGDQIVVTLTGLDA